MKRRYVTQAATTAVIGLVFAVIFPQVSSLAFAESGELLRYTSLDPTVSGNHAELRLRDVPRFGL